MEKRERMVAVSVLSREALCLCLKEDVPLICIENPLYSQIYHNLTKEAFAEYQIEEFADKQVIMLTKVRGKNAFDSQRYEPFYLPLFWDKWHS